MGPVTPSISPDSRETLMSESKACPCEFTTVRFLMISGVATLCFKTSLQRVTREGEAEYR